MTVLLWGLQSGKPEKKKTDSRIKKPSPKALEKKLLALEENIASIEQLMSELDHEIDAHAADYERLEELLKEKNELQIKHETLLAQWMEMLETGN